MAIYSIYKYELSQIDEREAETLCSDSKETPLSLAQEAFDGLFRGERPLNITRENKEKVIIPLDNEIMAKRDRVTLLLVCNEKTHKYVEKLEEREFQSHPGCRVVIDNREGIAQMAIERSPSFQSDPDRVCLLLGQAINDKLAAYRLKIKISGKVREATLWEIVHKQTHEHNDRIKWVKFNFSVPEETAGIDATENMKLMLSSMNTVARAMGGEKGLYQVLAPETGTLHFDQTKRDLAEMVRLCTTNAYDIQVGFQYYGIYRLGRQEKALSTLGDELLNDFIHGRTTMDDEGHVTFGLYLWLNNMRTMYEDYEDVTPVKKTRKRDRKKKSA